MPCERRSSLTRAGDKKSSVVRSVMKHKNSSVFFYMEFSEEQKHVPEQQVTEMHSRNTQTGNEKRWIRINNICCYLSTVISEASLSFISQRYL